MKKAVFTLVVSLVGLVVFSQAIEGPQLVKYITEAPDGSIAMTIIDDSREDNLTLESADDFYKYQILDPATSEPIYSSNNSGKECQIDKKKLAEGTYDLRLYTTSFVITSKITISATRKFNRSMKVDQPVAMNE